MKYTRTLLITLIAGASLVGGGCMSSQETPTTSTTSPVTSQPAPSNGKVAAREVNMTGCTPKAMEVNEPGANTAVTFPFTVKAIVHNADHKNCTWTMFEAQAASMDVKDSSGKVVAHGVLKASGEWMTDAPVSFEGKIEAVDGVTPSGVLNLVITEENPSGVKDSQTITIPIFVQGDNI